MLESFHMYKFMLKRCCYKWSVGNIVYLVNLSLYISIFVQQLVYGIFPTLKKSQYLKIYICHYFPFFYPDSFCRCLWMKQQVSSKSCVPPLHFNFCIPTLCEEDSTEIIIIYIFPVVQQSLSYPPHVTVHSTTSF